MKDSLISTVLGMKCFTVQDLRAIADKLGIRLFNYDKTSFKQTYRALGSAIQRECNVSFGMVEGLHRIYTVKNMLEGRLLQPAMEPVTKNSFLKQRVTIHLHILDKFTKEDLSPFSELSLLYLKVRNAGVARTLFDELSQVVIDIQQTNQVVNLKENEILYGQFGRYDKDPNHILYNQRLFIYTLISTFAFNDKKSTVLHKYQSDHVSQAVAKAHIRDKHQYLCLPVTKDLADKDLFSEVAKVAKENLSIKAQEFTTICTKSNSRNNDWTMKPICQEVRVVMSYFVLAAISVDGIVDATRLFSSSYKFVEQQSPKNIDIIETMYAIVSSVDSVVSTFRKMTGISANEIHASKLDQLLQMNLFQDVIKVVKRIGHNPSKSADIVRNLCPSIEEDDDDTILIQLLGVWRLKVTCYMQSEQSGVRMTWKNNLIDVCRGGEEKTKSDIKRGLFGCKTFASYSVDQKLLFSFFVEKVYESSLSVYDVTPTTEPHALPHCTWNDIAQDYVNHESDVEISRIDSDKREESADHSIKGPDSKTVSNSNSLKDSERKPTSSLTSTRMNATAEEETKLAPIFTTPKGGKRKTKRNSGRVFAPSSALLS